MFPLSQCGDHPQSHLTPSRVIKNLTLDPSWTSELLELTLRIECVKECQQDLPFDLSYVFDCLKEVQIVGINPNVIALSDLGHCQRLSTLWLFEDDQSQPGEDEQFDEEPISLTAKGEQALTKRRRVLAENLREWRNVDSLKVWWRELTPWIPVDEPCR